MQALSAKAEPLPAARRVLDVPDRWVVWAAALGMAAGLLALLCHLRTADLDMWHQMALFREALAAGSLPSEDMFAYTPTLSPVYHHEWGTGAALYLATVSSGLGEMGLMGLKYLLVAAIAVGCACCARRQGADTRILVWLGPVAIGLGWIGLTTLRAQVFTLLFLTGLLLLFEEDRRGKRWWLAVWLPMYVVWLNMHAGFVVGAGLFALYTLERVVRELAGGAGFRQTVQRTGHLLLAAAAMVALLGVSPYGYRYLPHLWYAVSLERPEFAEWRPLWQAGHTRVFFPVYVISLVVVFYAIARRGVRDLRGLLLVLVTAAVAARHFRHISIYAVVWFCYLPAYLEPTDLGRAMRQIWLRVKRAQLLFWSLAVGAGLAVAISHQFWQLRIPTTRAEAEIGLPTFPAGAVAYLQEQGFRGNLMVPFESGAFVMWKLYPAVKVSLDSRYEAAYPPGAVEEGFSFYRARPGWEEALRRYSTDAVLVPRSSPLDRLLKTVGQRSNDPQLPRWYRVYRDDGYSIFARESIAAGLPLVDRTGRPIAASFP